MSAREFSAGKGFAEATLRWWAWKLRGSATVRAEPEPIPLLRVLRSDEPAAVRPGRATSIEIVLGGARVSVGAGVDRATLRDVLDVLGAVERERGR